jgi:uncharacterized protein (TIRG00374 family)
MIRAFIDGLLTTARPGVQLNEGQQGLTTKFYIRVGGSIAMLALLFWWLPVDVLLRAIASIPLTIWLLVVGIVLVLHTLSAFKWRMLLRATGTRITWLRAMRAHGAGMFATMFLPGNVGGDFIRAAVIVREQKGKLGAIAMGSLADRLNDMVALVLIAFVASRFLPDTGSSIAGDIMSWATVLLLAGVLVGVMVVRLLPIDRLPESLQKILQKLRLALASYASFPQIALAGLFLSMLIQCGFIALNIVFATTMNMDAPVVLWFFAWPLTKLAALAPVSVGGIGVRSIVLAGLMAPFGIDAGSVVAQSLCWDAVMVFSGVAGILFADSGFRAGQSSN